MRVNLEEDAQAKRERKKRRRKALKLQRDGWKETAIQHARSSDFYRGLVIEIGELFGDAAKRQDDGGLSEDVLCLLVPGLARGLKRKAYTLEEAVRLFRDDPEASHAEFTWARSVLDSAYAAGLDIEDDPGEPADDGAAPPEGGYDNRPNRRTIATELAEFFRVCLETLQETAQKEGNADLFAACSLALKESPKAALANHRERMRELEENPLIAIPAPCSVCAGDCVLNGGCICEGVGTAAGEMHGLRKLVSKLEQELPKWQEAVGLLSTLGTMEIDADDPVGMAKYIESEVRKRITDLTCSVVHETKKAQDFRQRADVMEEKAKREERANVILREGYTKMADPDYYKLGCSADELSEFGRYYLCRAKKVKNDG